MLSQDKKQRSPWLTCTVYGDVEPPDDPGHHDAVGELEAVEQQLDDGHAGEQHQAPASLGVVVLGVEGQLLPRYLSDQARPGRRVK